MVRQARAEVQAHREVLALNRYPRPGLFKTPAADRVQVVVEREALQGVPELLAVREAAERRGHLGQVVPAAHPEQVGHLVTLG